MHLEFPSPNSEPLPHWDAKALPIQWKSLKETEIERLTSLVEKGLKTNYIMSESINYLYYLTVLLCLEVNYIALSAFRLWSYRISLYVKRVLSERFQSRYYMSNEFVLIVSWGFIVIDFPRVGGTSVPTIEYADILMRPETIDKCQQCQSVDGNFLRFFVINKISEERALVVHLKLKILESNANHLRTDPPNDDTKFIDITSNLVTVGVLWHIVFIPWRRISNYFSVFVHAFYFVQAKFWIDVEEYLSLFDGQMRLIGS